jgi:hypothetical protein
VGARGFGAGNIKALFEAHWSENSYNAGTCNIACAVTARRAKTESIRKMGKACIT